MKTVRWNAEKNEELRKKRGVCFEDVLAAVDNGDLLDVLENASPGFEHQKCLVVRINGYPYVVPFVETDDELFLKTIFPSRRLKRKYGG